MSFSKNPDPSVLSFSLYSKVETSPDGTPLSAATRIDVRPSRFALRTEQGKKSVSSVDVEMKFLPKGSWVLKSKVSDAKLLEHERLHYMLACAFGRRFHDGADATKQAVWATRIREWYGSGSVPWN